MIPGTSAVSSTNFIGNTSDCAVLFIENWFKYIILIHKFDKKMQCAIVQNCVLYVY